jgi:cobyrinic acid a,c-diamide synthase
VNRILISAAHKSSGKTTVSLGLAAALRARGLAVRPYKKGPDYIDPMWLSLACGRDCHNLDPQLSDAATLRAGFEAELPGADVALVEGNHGLYDGLALDGSTSNAALARLLGLPVLLVIDVRGMTRGLAPLLLGYQAFDREIRIGGVIFNRVGGSRHESRLRQVVEHYTDLPVLGSIAEDPRLSVTERHLGLMPCAELDDAIERIARIGQLIGQQADLNGVLALAASASPPDAAPADPALASASASASLAAVRPQPFAGPAAQLITARATASPAPFVRPQPQAADRLRIAIARDRAFGFYYPDDLRALREAGADLVPLDTLLDADLPDVDGLLIGGGFPETSLAALQANRSLRHALRDAIEAGLPTYAECGGLMYLCRSIRHQDRSARMVGVIPADAVMMPRPVGRGYVRLQVTENHPFAPPGAILHGHEFHHSRLENLDDGVQTAYRVQRGHGLDGAVDGIRRFRMLAAYTHLRTRAGSQWAPGFVDFVRACREDAGAGPNLAYPIAARPVAGLTPRSLA